MSDTITISTIIHAPLESVWNEYTRPEAVVKWNAASDDWHCPHAENDLRTGGHFLSRMEAKDGSEGFDFEGTYDEVIPLQLIAYSFGQRKATVRFTEEGDSSVVTVVFDPEDENPLEMQRAGWQAILDNFKKYAESH